MFGQSRVKKNNIYKITPEEKIYLSCPKVKNNEFASNLSDNLTVKELGFNRHKIAVNVMMGQAADQRMEVKSRCVLDDKNDNSICVTFSHDDLFTDTHDVGSMPASCPSVLKNQRLSYEKSVTEYNGKCDTKVNEVASSSNGALLRRRSTFQGMAQSLTGVLKLRRMTRISNAFEQKPIIKYENTFKTGPDSDKKFSQTRVQQLANEVLERELEGESYCPNTAGRLACNVANVIKNEVKQLNMPRYKIICQVIITDTKDQAMEAASKFLWDQNTDNHVCATFANAHLSAYAIVYAVYFE
ncbi:TC1D1-like protein [Mya arenaria]|uniref:TC1D1-like protein n=1 Tax=Mya arenaria TaxID=6604 RepID=A0ABY7DUU7_MYAAR|nr:TC1D1-like protein [Mya arenaria]